MLNQRAVVCEWTRFQLQLLGREGVLLEKLGENVLPTVDFQKVLQPTAYLPIIKQVIMANAN